MHHDSFFAETSIIPAPAAPPTLMPRVIICEEAKFAWASMIANVIMKISQTRLREFMMRSPVSAWRDR
jgi:hypothetical protein